MASILGAVAGYRAHVLLLADACSDRGGRYLAYPPGCEMGTDTIVSLGWLPGTPSQWSFALLIAALVGGTVFVTGRSLLRRTIPVAG
jgi:hypothetical protein